MNFFRANGEQICLFMKSEAEQVCRECGVSLLESVVTQTDSSCATCVKDKMVFFCYQCGMHCFKATCSRRQFGDCGNHEMTLTGASVIVSGKTHSNVSFEEMSPANLLKVHNDAVRNAKADELALSPFLVEFGAVPAQGMTVYEYLTGLCASNTMINRTTPVRKIFTNYADQKATIEDVLTGATVLKHRGVVVPDNRYLWTLSKPLVFEACNGKEHVMHEMELHKASASARSADAAKVDATAPAQSAGAVAVAETSNSARSAELDAMVNAAFEDVAPFTAESAAAVGGGGFELDRNTTPPPSASPRRDPASRKRPLEDQVQEANVSFNLKPITGAALDKKWLLDRGVKPDAMAKVKYVEIGTLRWIVNVPCRKYGSKFRRVLGTKYSDSLGGSWKFFCIEVDFKSTVAKEDFLNYINRVEQAFPAESKGRTKAVHEALSEMYLLFVQDEMDEFENVLAACVEKFKNAPPQQSQPRQRKRSKQQQQEEEEDEVVLMDLEEDTVRVLVAEAVAEPPPSPAPFQSLSYMPGLVGFDEPFEHHGQPVLVEFQ